MEDESKSSTPVDYLDFDLEIGQGSGQRYPVKVVQSVAGEADEVMDFPFGDLVLENHLLTLQKALLCSGEKRRRIPLPEEQAVQRFGQALFEALMRGEVRSRYAVSQREAGLRGKGLRLKLRIQSPQLAVLPWEFLYDPEHAEYVCLSRSTPLVRYLELPGSPQPLTVTLPLRILGMIATPSNLAELDIKRERERVEQALKPLRERGAVLLSWMDGQTWQDLLRAMRQGPWHVFHFIGHGGFDALTDEGLIALSNQEGQANLLSATQVGRLLADHWSLRLVVLNACEGARGSKRDIFSSTAATLVRRGIPAVLAMQYEITDQAAIELSRAFYEAVVDGMPVDAALTEARKAVSLGIVNTLEWGTPVLYMRSPNGILFRVEPPSPVPPARPAISALEKASSQSSQTPLVQPSTEEGLRPLGSKQAVINQKPSSPQIIAEAASASSFMKEQTVPPQVPPGKAPISTTPPTKAMPVETVKAVAPSSQLSQPTVGATLPHAPAAPFLPPIRPSHEVLTKHEHQVAAQISQRARSTQLPQVKRNATLRLAYAAFFLLAVLIGGSVFFFATRGNNPPGVTSTPPISSRVVHMRQTDFDPPSITISVNDSINLINDVSVRHTLESGTWEGNIAQPAIEPGAPEVHGTLFSVGQTMELGPFTSPGIFHYFCTDQPSMNLKITVQ